MSDSADSVQRLYLGDLNFNLRRYPKCIGVVASMSALPCFVLGVDGLQILGTPGWRMGEVLGVSPKGRTQNLSGKARFWTLLRKRLATVQKFREELVARLHESSRSPQKNNGACALLLACYCSFIHLRWSNQVVANLVVDGKAWVMSSDWCRRACPGLTWLTCVRCLCVSPAHDCCLRCREYQDRLIYLLPRCADVQGLQLLKNCGTFRY